jgi:O-antigen ligase
MIWSIQNLAEKATYFFLILFGVLLPYDMLYATLAVYPILFFSLISFRKEKLKQIPKYWWVFTLIFLLNVIGYFYTADTHRASYLLERQLIIFLFPLILPLAVNVNNKKNNLLFISFTLSCLAAILFLLYPNFLFLQSNHWSLKVLSLPHLYNHSFTQPLGIHATYLSLYTAMCIIFLIDCIPRVTFIQKLPLFLALIILLIGLYFMASRNTMLALLFIGLFVYPLFRLRNKFGYFLISILLVGGLLFTVNQNHYIFNRFSIDLVDDLKPDNHYTIENPEPRILRWKCAVDLIKEKPILGFGAGDEIPLLMKLYKERGMTVSYKEEFNTHNQYLAILIKNGIIGLIVFLSMMFYFFRLAIQSKNFMYLSFLILITIGFITENIIDANKGIFFFAFFNTLLGYQIINEKKKKLITNQ